MIKRPPPPPMYLWIYTICTICISPMPMYVLTHFIPFICEIQQAKEGCSSKAGSEVVGHAPTKPAHAAAACLLYYYFVENYVVHTLNSWGYSAVITMPTQKQRLVNLTQTARHEVKMDTSTFLILTHWSPGLFFPFEVHNRQGFLPNPWGPMVIHHFDSSTPHHHPQLILQAENCLPTWYIRRWCCCCCCHRHWCCHIWDRRNHDDDGQHWDDLCKKEEWCQGEIVPDPVLTPIDVSGNFFFRSYD